MAPNPFVKGKNAKVVIVLEGEPIALAVKSWSVTPNVTTINDGVNGEDRDRLDVETNSFNIRITAYLETPLPIRKMFAMQANQDAMTAPTSSSVGFRLQFYDGSKLQWATSGQHTVDGWNVGSGGRVERLMLDLPMRCQYAEPLQA